MQLLIHIFQIIVTEKLVMTVNSNQLSTKVDSNIENERQKNCKTYRKQIAR